MQPRTTLMLALSAGIAAPVMAQEVMQISHSWIEVVANTTTPVASPNSVLDPGEGARIRVGATALINGVNAVGQTSVYTTDPFAVGTVRGLGLAMYDLVGDASSAEGGWTALQKPANPPFWTGGTTGTVQPGGSSIIGFGGRQFIGPGGTANSNNNNTQVFRGVWTPASYVPRSVNFSTRGSVTVAPDTHSAILLCYGFDSTYGPSDPFTYDLIATKYVAADFGGGVSIPIVPSPASAVAVIGLFAWAGVRGRCR